MGLFNTILLVVLPLVIVAEIIYIYLCRKETKKEIKHNWADLKVGSILVSMFIILMCWLGYVSFIRYLKQTLLMLIVIIILVLYVYLNKKIGIWVAKKK